ncbi:hypothetical protein INT45_010833 [Circinella minor]|uniref:Uncharacterized protein n=1 Tax=Circinella minor TaxID=1195481 RepID=A0A8H7S8U4_9FUNG|nr:hypothetical protein INT45_010833 [Circinella minor]
MKNIQGWAHLCFFSPFADNDGAFCEFRGHVISKGNDLNTTNTTTFGIAGAHLPNHKDPYQNDCMDPILFYQTTIKNYDSSISTTIKDTLLVRRVAQDDAAGLYTETYDNQDKQKLIFETEKFLVGSKAIEHVKKYLGQDILKEIKEKYNNNNNNNTNEEEEEEEIIVCMGNIQINI